MPYKSPPTKDAAFSRNGSKPFTKADRTDYYKQFTQQRPKKKQTTENAFFEHFDITKEEFYKLIEFRANHEARHRYTIFMMGVLFMPVTLAGALVGYVRGFNRFYSSKQHKPNFYPLHPILGFAMAVGVGLAWIAVAVFIIAAIIVGKVTTYSMFPIYGYLACNLVLSSMLFGVFQLWRIGINNAALEREKFGSARFARKDELYTLTNKTGYYIGDGHLFNDRGHILTVAGTRGGKGTSLIIPNLLGAGNIDTSWVVIDPKGENAAITADYQRSKGQNVVILNPWDLLVEHVGMAQSFNPLDILSRPTDPNLVDDVQMIAEMIVPVKADDHNSFFSDSARVIISGLLMHLVTTETGEKRTLKTLWEWVRLETEGTVTDEPSPEASKEPLTHKAEETAVADDAPNKEQEAVFDDVTDEGQENVADDATNEEHETVKETETTDNINSADDNGLSPWDNLLMEMGLNETPVNGEIVQNARREILRMQSAGGETFGSIMSDVLLNTDFLKSPALQESLKSEFDPKDLADGKTTVYVIIPADKLKTHSRWLRLVTTSLMRAVIRNPKKRVTFLLDEFAALGYLPEIETALSTYAGYNVTVWPILQTLVQLEHLYKENWQTFIANCTIRQYFSINDNFSAGYISEAIGHTSNMQVKKAWFGVRDAEANARFLITPDELRRESGKKIFMFISDLPPTYVDKRPYYLAPHWNIRAKENPYMNQKTTKESV